MDWNLVRQHVANTTVEERNAKRQEVSSDDVEAFVENYGKVSSGVANSAGSNSYVSSAERTANANALDALERRRKRAQEYLEKKSGDYKNGDELLSDITNSANDIEVLKRTNTAVNDYWNQWSSESDYNDYLDYVKEQERLAHLNIKEARDKKYALEQERDSLGKDIKQEVGKVGTVGIVASGRKGQNQNAYYGLASKETEQRRLELEREIQALDRDINLASRIQQANFEKNFALEAPDFEEYSLAGKNIRDDLAEQASNVYTHEAFSKNYRNPNVIDQTVRFMNDEQRQIYDYYLGKYGKERADEYLYTIADDVNMRKAEAIYEGSEDNFAYQTLLTLASGVEQWSEGHKSNVQMLMGSDEYRPQGSLQYAAGMAREDLADVGVLPEWATNIVGDRSLGQMAFDFTQTAGNMLPSIVLGRLGGGIVGNVSLGLSASGNAYQEMIREGYNKEQARSYAALVGASETLLEHVLGGIGALGGKLSKAATTKLLTKVDNALARAAIKFGTKQMAEFTEEYLQEILDPFFRNLALMEENEIKLITPDAIYSGILGALSAGVFEGRSVISEEVQYQKADKFLAEKYSSIAGEAIENGLQRAEGSDMRKLAEAAQKKQEKGKDLSGRQMQELVLGEDKARIAEAAENRLKTLGETKDTAVVAKAIQKTVTGENLSAKERVALNHSTYGKRVLNELDPFNIVSESTSSAWTKDIGTREIGKDFYSRPKVEAKATEAEAQKTEEAKPVDVVEEAFKKSGIRIGSVGISSKDTVREVLSNVEGITPEAAEKLANVYEEEGGGVSANEFIRKTAKAFNIGYLNTPVESVKSVFSNSSVSPSAMMRAYYIGSETFAKKHKGEALASQATTIKGVKGKVVFEKGVDRKKLKPLQRVAIEVMEKVLADATNVEFHIFESYVRDGKRYYIDEFGVEHEGAPNGKFVGNVHQIWIDINAGGKGEGAMLFTLFHELTHNIHVWSPEHFNTLAKITAEAFAKGGYSFEDAVNSKMAQYAKYENYTRDNCIEEVIAEAMSGLGYDGKVIEDIANQVKAQDKTLWQKIVDWLGSIVDRIKKAYAQLSPSAPEAKILMQQKELFEQAQKVFAEAVVESGRAYRAAETVTEGAFKGLEKVTEGDSDIYQTKDGSVIAIAEKGNVNNVKYNIGEYKNGGKDILVKWLNSTDKKTGERIVDDKTRDQILNSMNYAVEIVEALEKNIPIFKEWGEVGITFDDSGKPVMRCRVKNGDYEINFDFSTVCKKRKALDAVLNNLVKTGKINLLDLSKSDIQFINDTLNSPKYGFEIACGLCFVDSKRYRVGEWASNAASMYNDIVQSLVKPEDMNKIVDFNFGGDKSRTVIEGDISTWDDSLLDFSTIDNILATESNAEGMGYRKAFAKLIKNNPKYRKLLLSSDIISSAGSDKMRNEASDLLAAVNAVGGTSKPKMSFSESIYDHSVILDTRVDKKTAFAMGGARTQSFSDFIATMFFDYCQMFAEAAGKGLPMQAYTKELSFAKLFGLTGVRINLSVLHGVNISAEDRAWLDSMYKYDKDGKLVLNIGKGKKNLERYNRIRENAGLDANGNYVYEQQSIDFDEAVKLQTTNGYSRFLGTIVVGISEKHIWKLLDDAKVRMIIPYHKSGLSAVIAKARNIDCYNDFTKHQNTRFGESWGKDAGKTKSSKELLETTKERLAQMKENKEEWDFYSVLHAYEKEWDTNTNSWKKGTGHADTITYEMDSNGVNTFHNDPMRQTCEDYLAWCEKFDMIPQFEQFIKHPNYYKMQEDFDVYDCITGEYVPQTPIEFKLPSIKNGDAFDAKDVLEAELDEQQRTSDELNEKMPEITKEIIDTIGKKIPPEIKVGKTMMQDRDSDGRELSKEQVEFFKDSKVRDEKGNLLTMYHGTNNDFWTFDTNIAGGKNGIAEGYGIYLTDKKDVANNYGSRKIEAYVNIVKPATSFKKTITASTLAKLIKDTCVREAQEFVANGDYDNVKDALFDTWISNYVITYDLGMERAYQEAARSILQFDNNDMDIIREVMSGMGIRSYADAMNFYHTSLTPITGFDGFATEWDNNGEKSRIYLAFDSNQIKSVDNKTPTADPDIRYSLREVEPVQPASGKWHRTSTTSEVMARFPDLWNIAAEESEVRNPTQVKITLGSYRNIYNFLKNEGFNGTILDASSGLGHGTKAGIEEYGFDVEDIEPYPDKNYHPKYKDYSKLHKKYDVIISNAVLNVIPQDQRDALVVKMGELLNDGGRIFVNVRGKDVENASSKVAINKDLMEYYISTTGSYQKGFTKPELVAYLQDALGDGFAVTPTNIVNGVAAVVTKNEGQPLYQEREEDLSERGILAKALESAAQGDIEAKNLKNYKKHLAEYDELNVQLHLMKVELDEARNAKDTAKVKELRDKITQTENRLAVFDKRLLKLEAAAPLKALVERERKNAVARADERLSKALASQKKKDAEKLDKALERAKESRQKTIDKLRESSKVKGQEMRRVLRESQEFARADGFLAGQMSQGREDAAKMRKMGEQYEAQIQKGKERLSEQKLMAEQKLLAQAERYRTSIKNATEGRHKTEIRNKIKRKIGQLNALLNGGKERHVPEAMRGAVASALDIINLDDQRYYTSRLNNLRDKLARATSSAEQKNIAFEIQKIELQQARFKDSIDELKASWEEIGQENDVLYDPLIAEKIDRVSLDIGKTLLHDMSMTQLEEIYDLYSMVLKRVQEANKLHDEQKKGEISELGKQAIAEFSSMKQRNKIVSANKLDYEKFSWNNEKPIYAFMRIGSKVLQERFEAIRNGEDTWARDISEAMDFFEKAKKQYNFKKWNRTKTFEFESSAGDKFSLDVEQMMSIYAYSKRKDADKHLMEGGFVFDPRTEIKKSKQGNKKLIQKHLEDATTYNISAETIQEIASKLTEEQRGYADTMQNYLSEVMGAKGNEVSMAMYDVKLFREKNYFPLKSSKLYRFETDNPAGEIKLKNSGFSKDRIPGANNPIVLTGFTDVWAGHVNDMSMYHAFVLPIDDFTRVYNYRTPIFPHQKSVKAELENVHGPAASAYIQKLLEDINGGARVDSTVGVWNRFVGRFKKASVMASLSVVIQQPSAIMRAFAEINPKYLIGLPKVPIIQHAKTWNEIKKYAPVAVIKDMGYFDTNMGLSTIDYIKGEKNIMEKVDDFFGRLPGYADESTWGAIWHMVKRETKAKHPSLKVSSDEFLELCGKRFTDIVVKTQVYDSVLSRSANMRSTDGLMKMATAFMAEPTTSINMLAQAVRDGKKHPGKSIAVATSVVSSVIFNSALSSLVYAMRDEEEDETFWEKYVKNFTKELADGFNILTYFPLYKDIWSIIQGWDIKRSDMDLIDKLHTKLMTLSSLVFTDTEDMSEEEKKEYNKQLGWAIAETTGALGDLVGIPAKNLIREFKGAINTYNMWTRQHNEETKLVGTKLSMRHAFANGLIDILPEILLEPLDKFGIVKDRNVQDKIYEAVMAGDAEYLNRLKKDFDSDKAFDKQIRWALRNNDERLVEAVIARHEGRFKDYENLVKEMVADGFSKQNVITAVEAETFEMFPEESEETVEKIKGLYNADDFLVAYNKNNNASMEVIRDDIIKTHVANGKTEDEAEAKFNSAIYSAVRERYENGEITEAAARKILENHSGRTEQNAKAAVTLWDYQAQYPDDDVEIYWINDYYEDIEASGVGLKTYVDYRNDAKLCKGKDANGDGKTDSGSVKKEKLLVIDALPISKEQKDAIYFSEGWAKSTLWEAPWR